MSLEEMADMIDDGDIQYKPCNPKYCKAKDENGGGRLWKRLL